MSFLKRSIVASAVCAASAGAQNAVPLQAKPLDPANMNTAVSACSDFFEYANGGWIKRNPVPAAFSNWGGFSELSEYNNAALLNILEASARDTNPKRSADLKKLGNYYASCMDSAGIERAGATPLRPMISQVNSLTSITDLQRLIGKMHAMGSGVLFNFGSTQDAKNTTSVIAGASQGGLSLPNRDYYTRTDPASVALRANFQDHVVRMLKLAGESDAQAATDAANVLAVETILAKASLTPVQRRDPRATYHKMSPAELAAMTPHFNWRAFFTAEGNANIPAVDVESPVFFKTVDSLFVNQPLEIWKSKLRWDVVNRSSGSLSSAFVNEDFRFNQALTGAKELLPRNKRCVRATDGALGDALGQAYVAKYFTPEAKSRALEMVKNMEAMFNSRISGLQWMSAATKPQAAAKLNAFVNKIGYTDRWLDYTPVTINRGSYYQNNIGLRAWRERRDIAKIGKPVDRAEWGMTPATVNAYYNPLMNEIVFPAGIMQPPFFNPKADDAVNYGGMGAVIGHEMSHGFDDQGSQFDAQGNLRNWWSPADSAAFAQRTGLIRSQFNDYTVLDSVHVNGSLTLGENLGDFGGLNIAYAALEKALADKGNPGLIDGFTPEQRFFLGWAQIWRQNIRPEAARVRINTDPHSPGKWRVNGPLSNMPEFAAAFGCKPSDAMVRADAMRPVIW
ncbi:MAG: M13 family metallopeptidase [Gemmatimonadaceae bacterium]|nr:M13 family metallopeptidase [Gemmatimonadaceae bacterium]